MQHCKYTDWGKQNNFLESNHFTAGGTSNEKCLKQQPAPLAATQICLNMKSGFNILELTYTIQKKSKKYPGVYKGTL